MSNIQQKIKYALPRGVDVIRIVEGTILDGFRNRQDATINTMPLIQRAYTIVNETGLIPYRAYSQKVKLLEDELDG